MGEEYQEAFDKIKGYLSNPPELVALQHCIPFILSHNNNHSNEGYTRPEVRGGGKGHLHTSKKFLEYETRYTHLKKTTLALVWVSKKLRHYMLTHMVHVVVLMDPIRYLLHQLATSGKVARWTVILLKFDLHYILRNLLRE